MKLRSCTHTIAPKDTSPTKEFSGSCATTCKISFFSARSSSGAEHASTTNTNAVPSGRAADDPDSDAEEPKEEEEDGESPNPLGCEVGLGFWERTYSTEL